MGFWWCHNKLPFDNFKKFETSRNLPAGFIRIVNSQNSDFNAWALLEKEKSIMQCLTKCSWKKAEIWGNQSGETMCCL